MWWSGGGRGGVCFGRSWATNHATFQGSILGAGITRRGGRITSTPTFIIYAAGGMSTPGTNPRSYARHVAMTSSKTADADVDSAWRQDAASRRRTVRVISGFAPSMCRCSLCLSDSCIALVTPKAKSRRDGARSSTGSTISLDKHRVTKTAPRPARLEAPLVRLAICYARIGPACLRACTLLSAPPREPTACVVAIGRNGADRHPRHSQTARDPARRKIAQSAAPIRRFPLAPTRLCDRRFVSPVSHAHSHIAPVITKGTR